MDVARTGGGQNESRDLYGRLGHNCHAYAADRTEVQQDRGLCESPPGQALDGGLSTVDRPTVIRIKSKSPKPDIRRFFGELFRLAKTKGCLSNTQNSCGE